MAVLSAEDRAAVTALFMQQALGPLTLLKGDIQAAVNGLDDWYNANAAAANAALPQPARTALNLTDKALLSNLIVTQRYVKGS